MRPLPTTIQSLLQAAAAARQAGRSLDEERLVAEALHAAPDHPAVRNAAGMLALGKARFTDSAKHFAAATESDPDQPALWMNLATALRGRGDASGEEQALQRVLTIDPRHFMARLRLAQCYQRSAKAALAVPAWRMAMQLAATIDELPSGLRDELRAGQAYLVSQNTETAARLDARFGSIAATPDGKRIAACIDHIVGRRTIYRNQCAGVEFPFLPSYEFFDRRLFDWMAALEAETPTIRKEALRLVQSSSEALRPYVRQEANIGANKWSRLDGSLDWSACFLWEYGVRNSAVCDLCPATVAALSRVPQTEIVGRAPTAFFSILRGGSRIPPHTGVTNTRTIVHLPLVVPDKCGFRVGGEIRPWREGEAFAFDDTIEHEAWNDSEDIRIVLILDVWNPYLTRQETAFLSEFFAMVDAQ